MFFTRKGRTVQNKIIPYRVKNNARPAAKFPVYSLRMPTAGALCLRCNVRKNAPAITRKVSHEREHCGGFNQ